MTAPPSLSFQRQCLEHLIALGATQVSDDVLEGARRGVLTLAWVERRQELLRALVELDRRAPALADIFRQWPEARIEEVRTFNVFSGLKAGDFSCESLTFQADT